MRIAPLLSLATLVLAGATAAAAPVDPSVLSAIHKVKAQDYPSANAVMVVDDQTVVFQADGQFTNTAHVVRVVLTPTGKNEAATTSLDFAKDAEKMEVLTAQVIKPDGTVVPVAPESIRETEQGGEMNI